jgi:uncharacterized protein
MSSAMHDERRPAAGVSGAIASFLIRFRLGVLILFAVITAALGYHALQLRLDPGFEKSIPLKHPYMETFKAYEQVFGGANTVIVAVVAKDGDMFTPEFFDTYAKVNDAVAYLPGIDRATATSLFSPNVRFYDVNEEGFVAGRVIDADFQNTPEHLRRVRVNLLKSDVVGSLAAGDLSGALIRAELVERDPSTGETLDYNAVAQGLEAIRAQYETPQTSVHIIGFAKFIGDVTDGAADVLLFFGIAFLLTAVLLYFFSSSIAITVLALVVALTAVVWQLGLVQMAGYGLDPLSILVPFLILSIGVSHAVQMTNTWKLELLDGASPELAAHEAFCKLFLPGITALIANAVGFAVIMLIDIAIIHELGITASIGVAVMIITNKFLLPVLLSWTRLGARTRARLERRRSRPELPIWSSLAALTQRRNATVVLVIAALVFGYGLWKGRELIVGDADQGAPELRADSRYNQDVAAIVNRFAVGVDVLTVMAKAPPEACTRYEVMALLDAFVWRMKNTPGVQSVRSLPNFVLAAMVGLNENNPRWFNLPRNSEMIAATQYYLEINMGLFNADCSAIPVYIYPEDHRAETLERIVEQVKAFRAEHELGDVELLLASGNAGVMAATNEAVEAAETDMLLALFAAVGVLCFITFLSWRASLCVLLPLVLVAYFANAVMVLLGIGLKVSTLPVVALGVGVGVDYGIYLFARTLTHMRAGLDLREAYHRALKQVGTAVIFTATTMTLGVATWYFSSLKFQADMGVLLAYMFFVNMVAAITVLPALAAWLFPRGKPLGRWVGGFLH